MLDSLPCWVYVNSMTTKQVRITHAIGTISLVSIIDAETNKYLARKLPNESQARSFAALQGWVVVK